MYTQQPFFCTRKKGSASFCMQRGCNGFLVWRPTQRDAGGTDWICVQPFELGLVFFFVHAEKLSTFGPEQPF